MLLNIILANIAVGLVGVLGAYSVIRFFAKDHHRLMFFVSFAAGAMIAVAFFDLLPEALAAQKEAMITMEFLVLGLVLFLLIEKGLIYYHCHEENCRVHQSVKLIMLGDAVHNLLDGVAIAASFMVSPAVGIFTTLAIIIHEIPQEIGDAGILLHAGYSRAKTALYNLITAGTGIAGGLLAYYALSSFSQALPYILAVTAGGFIYISAADLLPELHKDSDTRLDVILHTATFIFGILIIWLLGKYVGE
ncbi:MAG: ZIP family metal transporter [Patescibacteria group bacterium]